MRIVAGKYRSRVIEAPKGEDTRPTLDRVRENLFNIIQNRVPGSRVLDLFSGSGALALEAVSRGAVSAVLCDISREANRIEKQNVRTLGAETQCQIFCMPWQSCVRRLAETGMQFDVIFLDPPYRMTDLSEVCSCLLPLMSEHAVLVVEHRNETEPVVDTALERYDRRKYGYVGLSLYRRKDQEDGQ